MPMTLKNFNQLAEEIGGRPQYRGATISVHGMNCRGAWQKELSPCLQDAAIRHVPVDYGWVLIGVLRRKTIGLIAEKLLMAYEEQLQHDPAPTTIGHSLGTLTLGRLLRSKPDVSLKRMILFGSILHPHFAWTEMHETGQVDQVLNEGAANDYLPSIARWIIPDSGPSGRTGFKDRSGVVIEERYRETHHSGLEYRLHYKHKRIPFLLHGAVA
jgi:pimeloyl-ACP methyl ester carboxylesterase